MKRTRLFILTIISLLLPSCSNTDPQSFDDNIDINRNTSQLSEIIYTPNLNDTPKKDTENNENLDNSNKNNDTGIAKSVNLTNSNDNDQETKDDINGELLASYSSKVYTKTEDRQKNLRIVCDKLSGTILAPNEEFSYNEICGPYNKENGFGKATVFLGDGTETEDYGGGVCQLSSTLYNAIKNLNVEVTERHNHSKKVYYVPDGQDATVSYGNLDFKFKNLNDYSILIKASSSAQSVDVSVYKI